MTAIETKLQNAFETQLSAEMGPNDTSAQVNSLGTLNPGPAYVVIEPDDDLQREYILFDGTWGALTMVAQGPDRRYLSGSAAGSNITHPINSVVRVVPMAQHFEDLHDRIDLISHDSLNGLLNDHHTQYPLVDGSRGFSGAVVVGEPSIPTQAATKSYVDAQVAGGIAPGFIMAYAGGSAPGGWLLADGSAVSRATYNDLWLVIGTTYGSGDGSTTFNLPDLVNRSIMGAGSTVARAATAGALTDSISSHTHSMPSHSHFMNHVHDVGDHTHSINPSNHYTSYAIDGIDRGSGTSSNQYYNYKIASEHGDHRHTVDIGSFSSGVPNGIFDTEGSSTTNTGSTDPGDTNSAGGATVDVLHPVIGLDYYIKT